MIWRLSHRFDPFAAALADKHYSRQKPGTPQFAPAGSCIVFTALTDSGRAFWVTSAPEYAMHEWQGAWVCSAFRNEGAGLAHRMVQQAVAATLAGYGAPPDNGMVTFVDEKKVKPFITPKGRTIFGQCFRQAGFREVGRTKRRGHLVLQLLPDRMPAPEPAIGVQFDMFDMLGVA